MPNVPNRNTMRVGIISLVLVAVTLGSTMVIASTQDDPPEQSARDDQPEQSEIETSEAPLWATGLPIDTPPSDESAVHSSPPAGEEAQWSAVAVWAATACGFDGNKPDTAPAAMYKTTAGEVRRRVAARSPESSQYLLGSNWANEDVMYIVAFRGTFHHRSGPPTSDPDTKRDVPVSAVVNEPNACLYYGNGKTGPDDNGSVGITHRGDADLTLEALFVP